MMLFDTREYSVAPNLETDSDQRYTPKQETDRVVRYLGSIGLDPTANPQKTVPARSHITEKQDCFLTDWSEALAIEPTLFMNPPYSDSSKFLHRMAGYLRSNELRSAVTLTLSGVLQNKSTQPLIKELAIAVCCPFGRINFVGGGNSNDRDVVWIAWGVDADVNRFRDCFDGLVLQVR